MPERSIAVLDLGGQYCHLIGRRLRDLGVRCEVRPPDVAAAELATCAGVILSGGPRSVYDPAAPSVDAAVLDLGVPVLGICYGHQLLVQMLGGSVARGDGEYGAVEARVDPASALFRGTPERQRVWMSHGDSVESLPPGGVTVASTARSPNAAFADADGRVWGVQLHPEVVHTEHGAAVLRNFAREVCGIEDVAEPEDRVARLVDHIRERAGDDSVFFLVSGGVDSTVAFALCARALPRARVLGLHVDTGLMRKREAEELRASLEALGLGDRLRVRDESERFLGALAGVRDPEEKRRIIGRLFVDVQAEAMRDYGIDPARWLLGQGTIYPDTIESGGAGGHAAVIKTHHNRCEEIRRLLEAGRVLEPLSELYKDQVRALGLELGLEPEVALRWPFPGPGLAIRCLCARDEEKARALRTGDDYEASVLPVSSVGVQGDERTYRTAVAVRGPLDYDGLEALSSSLCNERSDHNRVVAHLAGDVELDAARVRPAALTRARVELLREADHRARCAMEDAGLVDSVWQFPVVLIPVQFGDGETVVLRPVNSEDGMTASFARLPHGVLLRIAREIESLRGVDAVFLDVTHKPPATIEWE